jgi:glycerophosphoryl diester phosphodiesterase
MISDRPDLLFEVVAGFDGDGDGVPDLLTGDGLIDIERFDAQGHRGARDLRPESTLPAMEAGMDCLMTTLEFDNGIAADGVPILSHDPYLQPDKCRRADGAAYTNDDKRLIRDLDSVEIQRQFIADRLIRGPQQRNGADLSPVSVAFAAATGLPHLYSLPTTRQVFEFTAFYVDYYRGGPRRGHPLAARRWRNAERIRFNIETKINPRPRPDADARGIPFAERTVGPEVFADQLAGVIEACGMTDRADVQSFDFRTLLRLHEHHPSIRTVFLFGDYPIEAGDEGTNMQGGPPDSDPNSDPDSDPDSDRGTPWMAGLAWPYRATRWSCATWAPAGPGAIALSKAADGRLMIEVDIDGMRRMIALDPATGRFAIT